MNTINLIGRLTAEPTISKINSNGIERKVAKYTLAVERDKKDEVDYILCSVIDKGADWIEKNIKKGVRIGIEGSLRISSYEKNSTMIYKSEIIVRKQYFA